jgi:hypothetical protein
MKNNDNGDVLLTKEVQMVVGWHVNMILTIPKIVSKQ